MVFLGTSPLATTSQTLLTRGLLHWQQAQDSVIHEEGIYLLPTKAAWDQDFCLHIMSESYLHTSLHLPAMEI